MVLTCLSPAPVRAEAPPAKKAGEAFKEIGKEFKDFGKKAGEAGKEAGLEVAEVAKKIWYKSWKVSKPKLDQVQEATREFWRQVIEGKDRTVDELRRENTQLRRRLAEEGGD
jgi:hypothetical protein